MRYTVAATRKARRQLARVWTTAGPSDRAAITFASDAIDAALAHNPKAKARKRSDGLFIYDEPPLRAYLTISDPDRRVSIYYYALIA
jgi:hypothetical protein